MPRKVTVDDMVEAIREAGKPCTKQDIADRTDVSRQTIANHAEELENDGRVEYGKVGTANAYWLTDPLPEADEQLEDALEDSSPEDGGRPPEQEPPAGDVTNEEVIEESGELIRDDLDDRQTQTSVATDEDWVEIYANRRTVVGGTALMLLGMILFPAGGTIVANGALGPGLLMLTLALVTVLGGVATIGVAVVCQIMLARPLKGLVFDIDETEVGA